VRKDLGLSLIATRGYAFSAVEKNYERALRLSSSFTERGGDVPIPILYGLWGTYFMRGDRKATDQLARDFEKVRESPDPLARHVAHSVLGARAFYHGEFRYAAEQFEQGIRLYAPEHHFVLTRDYGYAGGLYSHSYLACVYCFIGCPDRGLALATETVAITRALNDPYAQATALGFACCVARERGDPARAKALSGDLAELATRHEFVLWLHIALCLQGWASLCDGDVARAADQIRSGLETYEATGARLPGQYLRLILIESDLARGDLDAGLANVEVGLRRCRETFDSYLEPEYHRVKGELLELTGDLDAAESEIRTALGGARRQGATWMELRAALSLAKHSRRYGRTTDAPSLLARVVSQLTEGSGTPELQEAQALLVH
jgi:predicted ATPase